MGGGSVRYYFSPRLSAGPEVLLVRRCSTQTFTFYHPRISATVYLALDLNQSPRFRPYLLGGVGFVRHGSPPGLPARNSNEFAGGGGVKVFLSDRIFVAPEFQIGGRVWFTRVTGSLGWMLR
jgi:hypothetical protein